MDYLLCRFCGIIVGVYNCFDLFLLVICGVDENDMLNGIEGIVVVVEGW